MIAKNVIIAGTGKMALNIGSAILRQGCNVHWVSRNPSRAAEVLPQFSKNANRILRGLGDRVPLPTWSISSTAELAKGIIGDIILESSVEDCYLKRDFLASLKSRSHDGTLFLSNSSSILPQEISPDVIGCHFFYPLDLNPFVELIVPQNMPDAGAKAKAWCEQMGWRTILQNQESAFIINRVLLPIQALAMRLLRAGCTAEAVEKASNTAIIPLGILSMMDAIGFDVLLPSIKAYAARMVGNPRAECLELAKDLEELVLMQKLGNKNNNGLLCGEALPWKELGTIPDDFGLTAKQTVDSAIASGAISMEDMRYVVRELWGSAYDFGEGVH